MYTNRGRESDFEHARDTFQAVMDLDPRLAAAPAGLARLHSVRIFTGVGSESVAADMERWATTLEGVAFPRLVPLLDGTRTIFTGVGSDSVAADMERWARQALALDPRSGTAWCVLADVEQLRRPNDYRVRLEYAGEQHGPGRPWARQLRSNGIARLSFSVASTRNVTRPAAAPRRRGRHFRGGVLLHAGTSTLPMAVSRVLAASLTELWTQ